MPRTDWTSRFQHRRMEYRNLYGQDPLEYVSRAGGGEPARYVFSGGTVKLGAREALAYLEGLMKKEEAARSE